MCTANRKTTHPFLSVRTGKKEGKKRWHTLAVPAAAACLEKRRLEKSNILVSSEHPGELVRHQVHHLDPQHGAIDKEVPALIEDRILSVQRARGLTTAGRGMYATE